MATCGNCGQPGIAPTGVCHSCGTEGPGRADEATRRAASLVGNPVARAAAADKASMELYEAPNPADDEAWLAAHPGSVDDEARRGAAEVNAEFWDSRASLKRIREMAYARIVSPWALLAEVLARCVVLTSPKVQLPPLVGGNASLNLYFGVVGASGGGKGGAANACESLMDWGTFNAADELIGRGIGSGEGIPKLFVDPQTNGEVDRVAYAALVSVAEIDSMTAQTSRNGPVSTLAGQIRQAWNGEALGFHYANKDKRTYVPRHDYRLCLVVGIQPKRAGALFAEADGGTPQRFVWLPAKDPDMPLDPPADPAPMMWSPHDVTLPSGLRIPSSSHADMNDPGNDEPIVLKVCDEALTLIRQEAIKRHREPAEALDGHLLLCREKVAAALGLLEGHAEVTPEDWRLAALVMEMSALTRASILAELSADARQQNEAAGYAEASRARIVKGAVERDEIKKTAERIVKKLTKAGDDWTSRGKIRANLSQASREWFDEAIDILTDAGRIERRNTQPGHGEVSDEYRMSAGA